MVDFEKQDDVGGQGYWGKRGARSIFPRRRGGAEEKMDGVEKQDDVGGAGLLSMNERRILSFQFFPLFLRASAPPRETISALNGITHERT
jgi:hypothetical protein